MFVGGPEGKAMLTTIDPADMTPEDRRGLPSTKDQHGSGDKVLAQRGVGG